MNTHENLVIIKGVPVTASIASVTYGDDGKTHVTYIGNDKVYSYAAYNVLWLTEPRSMPLTERPFQIYKEVLEFTFGDKKYYRVILQDDSEYDFSHEYPVLNYIKECASVSALISAESEAKLLPAQWEKVCSVNKESALHKYLTGEAVEKREKQKEVIFPFGCNQSQIKAVYAALENQISIIQGPPGTGKTQTILNIIANLVYKGKSVLVVSNNNTAIENVLEKMQKYGLGFIVAKLGKKENKEYFLANQDSEYPQELEEWGKVKINKSLAAHEYIDLLLKVFHKKEELAKLQQEFAEVQTEKEHFEKLLEEFQIKPLTFSKACSSKKLTELWQRFQNRVDAAPGKRRKTLPFYLRWWYARKYGFDSTKALKIPYNNFILALEQQVYISKQNELQREIEEIIRYLEKNGLDELISQFTKFSLDTLKQSISDHYAANSERYIFDHETLLSETLNFLQEYPVTLSTTFSSKNNIANTELFDYVIMDEASQVDISTGALALSCARNAVIVGDSMQLPNVVTGDDRKKLEQLFGMHESKLNSFYNSANYSFLDSVLNILPSAPQTLLREHYRCHPKIIEFCNQKFYKGQLIAMTEDHGEENVLNVYKTVEGNHCRGDHTNYRQIDCLADEVLVDMEKDTEDIGIIAPYRNQVKESKNRLPGFADRIATVHKFQGRENDTMIFMTTDDTVTSFSDDSNLLNVAISRAKNKFILITSENEQPENSNIRDLISYIEYKNGSVTKSNIHSVFDYLYKQYREARNQYLQNRKKISEYDSENLMFAVIEDALCNDDFKSYGVICHQPLNQLISDYSLITDPDVLRYAQHPATHLDFLIYNRVTKQPFLAIEVDGYTFHKWGTRQSKRDKKKNLILELYGIPLMRFSTRDSNVTQKLTKRMRELLWTLPFTQKL